MTGVAPQTSWHDLEDSPVLDDLASLVEAEDVDAGVVATAPPAPKAWSTT
jgi:hypothetical protein